MGAARGVIWLVVATAVLASAGADPVPVRAAGGTYYVGSTDGAASETAACTFPTNTVCTLRGALAQNAADGGGGTVRFGNAFPVGGTIDVSAGNTTPGDENVGVTLTSGATLDGTGKRVTISGNGAVVVFNVRAGAAVTFRALTITGGNTTVARCGVGNGSSVSGTLGGICVFGAATVTGSTVTGNATIANYGTLAVTSSTVTGNAGILFGGGIYNSSAFGSATVTVTSSTIVGNSAAIAGGGIYNAAALGNGAVTVTSSIVVGNSAASDSQCGGTITDGGSNLSYGAGAADTSCPATFARAADPLLAPPGNYGGDTQVMPPLPGGPAVDGGGYLCPATDQRGEARPSGAACDAGAVEHRTVRATVDAARAGAAGEQSVTLVGAGFQRNTIITVDNRQTAVLSVSPDGTRIVVRATGRPEGTSVPVIASNPNVAPFLTTLSFVAPDAAPTPARAVPTQAAPPPGATPTPTPRPFETPRATPTTPAPPVGATATPTPLAAPARRAG